MILQNAKTIPHEQTKNPRNNHFPSDEITLDCEEAGSFEN